MGSKPYFTVLARSSKSTTLPSKPTDLACKRQNIITCSLNFGCHSVKTSWQFLLVTHCYSGGDSSTKAPCNKGKPPRRRPKEVRSPSPEISSQLGKTKNHQRHKIKKKTDGSFPGKILNMMGHPTVSLPDSPGNIENKKAASDSPSRPDFHRTHSPAETAKRLHIFSQVIAESE